MLIALRILMLHEIMQFKNITLRIVFKDVKTCHYFTPDYLQFNNQAVHRISRDLLCNWEQFYLSYA